MDDLYIYQLDDGDRSWVIAKDILQAIELWKQEFDGEECWLCSIKQLFDQEKLEIKGEKYTRNWTIEKWRALYKKPRFIGSTIYL